MTPDGPDRPSRSHRHHHGAHELDAGWSAEEALAALESDERRRALDPEAFWDRAGLATGATLADVGAGTGYFALPAARRVGPNGRVFAIDVSAEMVRLLEERARGTNGVVRPVLAKPGAIPLEDGVADVVLLANVLHDISNASLGEAVRLLRAGGRFINLDWKKVESEMGPPRPIRLSPEEAERRLAEFGLVAYDRFEAGPWHYVAQLRAGPHGALRDAHRVGRA